MSKFLISKSCAFPKIEFVWIIMDLGFPWTIMNNLVGSKSRIMVSGPRGQTCIWDSAFGIFIR